MTSLAKLSLVLLGLLGSAKVQAEALKAEALKADSCANVTTAGDVKALVTGLGYAVGTEGTLLKIKINSNYTYPVYFSISADKTYLVIFTVLEDLPDEKVAKLPAVAILQFNDTHFNYLSLNKHKGGLRFMMQNTMPLSSATPSLLRTILNHLIEDSNNSDTLWNPAKWS